VPQPVVGRLLWSRQDLLALDVEVPGSAGDLPAARIELDVLSN
jgi:hypothetical protein